MKILYCGVYRDGTGWGQAAIDYILSLDAAGVEVVPRHIKLNDSKPKTPLRIDELESRSVAGCDVVIQHILPNMMAYNGKMKNIGLFASETSHFRGSGWADHLNMMDEVWVINRQQVLACERSGVKRPIHVVPHATNMERFQKTYKPLSILEHFKEQNEFVFYTIGEYTRRKNVMAMVKAFHLEFLPEEPVQLVLKVNIPGLSPEQCKTAVEEDCKRVKEGLKLHGCKQERVITERLSDEGIMRLHASCDVFVSSSTGEAWCALPGTLVQTQKGAKVIEDISVGDNVYSHTGVLRQVTATMNRHYDGEMISIKPRGLTEWLTFTPNHQHLVIKRARKHFGDNDGMTPSFIDCEKIKPGDFLAVPKLSKLSPVEILDIREHMPEIYVDKKQMLSPSNHSFDKCGSISITTAAKLSGVSFQHISRVMKGLRKNDELKEKIIKLGYKSPKKKTFSPVVKLTPDVMFMFGHFISEGDCGDNGAISFTTHTDEGRGRDITRRAMKQAFGLKAHYKKIPNTKCTRISFNSIFVASLFKKLFGHGSGNKHIPECLKSASTIPDLLRGLHYGDGSCSSNKSKSCRMRFHTSSKCLAADIVECLNRLDVFASKRLSRGNEYTVECSGQCNNKLNDLIKPMKYADDVQLFSHPQGQRLFLEDNSYFYLPVQKVKTVLYSGQVHNLSVAEDESYTCHGYATHNCIPAFDSMAMGRTPIVINCGGFPDYLSNEEGWLVNSYEEPCFGVTDSVQGLYLGDENWNQIDISHLRSCMREAYSNKSLRQAKAIKGLTRAYDFSYEEVGAKMKELLSYGKNVAR